MNFDAGFKLSFVQSLRKNNEVFYDLMRKSSGSQQNELLILTYYNRAVAYESIDDRDVEAMWNDLKTCLHAADFPVLKRLLYFFYSPSANAASGKDNIMEYLVGKSAAMETEFWANTSMERSFNELAEFSCFDDMIIEENLVEKYKGNGYYLNAKGWCDYYLRLLQHFMPEYSFSKAYSDKKMARFLADIGNGFHLGFEFDASLYKSELKRSRLFSPDFRIILINAGFDKSIKEADYWPVNDHPHIFVLTDTFKNPYFRGIDSLKGFFSEIIMNDSGWFFKTDKVKEGIQLKHDKKLGLLLKRFAFYDFYLTTHFIKPYLEYLAYAVKNIENKVSDNLLMEQINALEKRNQFLVGQIEQSETLLAQSKEQDMPKEFQEKMEKILVGLKTESKENTKKMKQYREQLKSSK